MCTFSEVVKVVVLALKDTRLIDSALLVNERINTV